MKPVSVEYVGEAETAYLKLNEIVAQEKARGVPNSENQKLLKSLKMKEILLKANPQAGDHIPQKNIPQKTAELYNTSHLWRLEIYNYWRAIYTITGNEVEILALVLDIVDHDRYNKLFRYKKK
ncbi:MAG: hypothetical protein V1911_01340 [Candidatus Micrarchaeota archaeon]